MIIPKRNAIEYGAVHIDNYLTFTGFCKKVSSDEICDVDVYIDGEIIETLHANKNIKKVEEIYDIEGHGFEYELEDGYFEKSHLLKFKAKENNEELVNSGIKTIDKNNDKFNEYKFMNSLSHIVEEKIKNMYCKDSIGFLAVEDNLNHKGFVAYIKELYVFFPQVTFKAFYFNNEQKKMIENTFNKEIERFIQIIPVDSYTIASEIEIYICSIELEQDNVIHQLIAKYCKNIYAMYTLFAIPNILNMTVKNFDILLSNNKYIMLQKPKDLGFTTDEINSADGSLHMLLYGSAFNRCNIENSISLNENVFKFRNFKCIKYILENKDFKRFFFNLSKKIRNLS